MKEVGAAVLVRNRQSICCRVPVLPQCLPTHSTLSHLNSVGMPCTTHHYICNVAEDIFSESALAVPKKLRGRRLGGRGHDSALPIRSAFWFAIQSLCFSATGGALKGTFS